MHSSCCMYDRRENGTKCYTCPRMTSDEREERKSEILATAAVH
nr:(2Fe-2S)-binding protein [Paenibacillus lupini]